MYGAHLCGIDLIADINAVNHNERIWYPVIPTPNRQEKTPYPLFKVRPLIAHLADCFGEGL